MCVCIILKHDDDDDDEKKEEEAAKKPIQPNNRWPVPRKLDHQIHHAALNGHQVASRHQPF